MANQTIVFGETKGALSERVLALEKLLRVPGIDVRASDAIMQDMWEKFVQLSTLAGITCLMRASIGDILTVPKGEEADLPPVRRTLRRRNGVRLRTARAVHRVRPKAFHHPELAAQGVDAAGYRTRFDH